MDDQMEDVKSEERAKNGNGNYGDKYQATNDVLPPIGGVLPECSCYTTLPLYMPSVRSLCMTAVAKVIASIIVNAEPACSSRTAQQRAENTTLDVSCSVPSMLLICESIGKWIETTIVQHRSLISLLSPK